MSELYFEIVKNSTLNKNVSTLIESYLLDPPKLPFLNELCDKTKVILFLVSTFIFNDRYFYDYKLRYPEKLVGSCHICLIVDSWTIRNKLN